LKASPDAYDENASLYSGAALLASFNFPYNAIPYLPTDGSDPAYVIQSRNSSSFFLDSYLFNLGLPTTSLVNYAGGNICGSSDGTNCDFSDFYVGTSIDPGVVTSGSLSAASSTPEPSDLLLVGCGCMGLGMLRRRGKPRAKGQIGSGRPELPTV
jgi:hypothetical protein